MIRLIFSVLRLVKGQRLGVFFYISNKLLNEHTSSTDESLTEASTLKKGEMLGCENSLMYCNMHTFKVLD